MATWPNKDPQAVLDYQIDWSDWLVTDTIDGSTWTVPTGITLDSESNTTTVTTAWLSGGTVGEIYILKNNITTSAGRVDERSVNIKVVQK